MKKILIACLFIGVLYFNTSAQGLGGMLKKAQTSVAPGNNGSNSGLGANLSSDDIINGLKEALKVAADSTGKKLSQTDGFFGNAAIKILMPDEAKKAEKKLRMLQMGSLVDKTILSMNRAAEDATAGIGDIFLDAIKQMTVTDGLKILQGSNTAATDYLKQTTSAALTEKFKPIILASLNKVNAPQYWSELFTNYNRVSSDKVNPDLVAYVTQKALDGLFYNIGLEEQKIRKDPAAQVTGILQKVFGGK
ncbi:MAG TPA: DUF4197 domain-containing protein [Ferruginibacter sp.]|nr:DUF4197 domain-containing protein [Ferruginibacter sp.]